MPGLLDDVHPHPPQPPPALLLPAVSGHRLAPPPRPHRHRPKPPTADVPLGDDIETTSSPALASCPLCQTMFTRIRRQLYCTQTCRKTAWRRRNTHTTTPAPIPAARPQRETTVYACPDCDTRYLGEQHCPDCNTFCTRIGPGGPCPSCDEPVAIQDLTNTDPPKKVTAMTDP